MILTKNDIGAHIARPDWGPNEGVTLLEVGLAEILVKDRGGTGHVLKNDGEWRIVCGSYDYHEKLHC